MRRIIICFLFLSIALFSEAKVVLPSVFADGMVLQQQTEAALWGIAKPNSKVVITTTWTKSKTSVNADAEGKWAARLSTPVAGGPYEITFNDGEKHTIKNVLIGEVWICSGQSNMEMPLKGFVSQPVEGAADIIIGAKPSLPVRVCMLKKNVAYEVQDDCPAVWLDHSPKQIGDASATAYFFARKLQEILEVPVGVVVIAVGGTYIDTWMEEKLLRNEFAGEFDFTHLQTRKRVRAKAHRDPCVLYNGMLSPVAGYTAKGFVWYQGCANVNNHDQYRRLQPAFVKMLRSEWQNENMPFYYTQLTTHNSITPEMKWIQALNIYDIPNSAIAMTLDVGDYACIHAPKKKEVGERLAYLALTRDYGLDVIDAKAPMPINYIFNEGEAIVTFDVGDIGLSPCLVELDGFELAGDDGVFYPAKCVVLRGKSWKGKSVKVYGCPEIAMPKAVRYAWKRDSQATLFNSSGIPVTPFSSQIR